MPGCSPTTSTRQRHRMRRGGRSTRRPWTCAEPTPSGVPNTSASNFAAWAAACPRPEPSNAGCARPAWPPHRPVGLPAVTRAAPRRRMTSGRSTPVSAWR